MSDRPGKVRPPKLPKIFERPPAGRVLAIAPHPDDEIMGPGATLLKHRRQGDPISVVIVFDGQRGDPDGHYAGQDLKALRQEESRRVVSEFLGSEDLVFHAFADGVTEGELDRFYPGLPEDPELKFDALLDGLAGIFAEHIRRVRPQTIYYPWAGEVHGDHWACGEAMRRVLERQPDLFEGVSVLGYEVWSTLMPELLVDVTDVIEDKFSAMRLYETQFRYADYVTLVGGLNLHRGFLIPPDADAGAGPNYAEAFVGSYVDQEATEGDSSS